MFLDTKYNIMRGRKVWNNRKRGIEMADFISNLYIHSFRGIHSLELEDLNKINILTGDNNSGKTSVLEVLQSFARPYSFRMWRSLLRKEPRLPSAFGMSYYEA